MILYQEKFLKKHMISADICVIPSLFDNSPNTVYEAMGNGKIVVASAVGGSSRKSLVELKMGSYLIQTTWLILLRS